MTDDALWIVMLDACFGIVQWALIVRFIYGIFLPEQTRLYGIRQLNMLTDPIIRAFGFVTVSFMIARVRPLYVAFYFLILRFYVLPTLIGYEVTGLQELSLEAITLHLMASF